MSDRRWEMHAGQTHTSGRLSQTICTHLLAKHPRSTSSRHSIGVAADEQRRSEQTLLRRVQSRIVGRLFGRLLSKLAHSHAIRSSAQVVSFPSSCVRRSSVSVSFRARVESSPCPSSPRFHPAFLQHRHRLSILPTSVSPPVSAPVVVGSVVVARVVARTIFDRLLAREKSTLLSTC